MICKMHWLSIGQCLYATSSLFTHPAKNKHNKNKNADIMPIQLLNLTFPLHDYFCSKHTHNATSADTYSFHFYACETDETDVNRMKQQKQLKNSNECTHTHASARIHTHAHARRERER